MRGGRTFAVTASVAAALAGRYAAGRRQEDRQTTAELESRLTDLGEVDRLSILPLVERDTARETLRGEAGVSYLIRTDGLTLLFDSGLGLDAAGQPWRPTPRPSAYGSTTSTAW